MDPDTEARSWAEEYTLSEEDRQQSAAEGRVFSEEELAKFQEAYSRANVGPGQTFEEWTKMYHPLVDPLRDEHDEAWDKLEKGWQTYKHEGWGYEGYSIIILFFFSFFNAFSWQVQQGDVRHVHIFDRQPVFEHIQPASGRPEPSPAASHC